METGCHEGHTEFIQVLSKSDKGQSIREGTKHPKKTVSDEGTELGSEDHPGPAWRRQEVASWKF